MIHRVRNPLAVHLIPSTEAFYHDCPILDGKFNAPVFPDAQALRRFMVVGQMFGKLQGIGHRAIEAHFFEDPPLFPRRDLLKGFGCRGAIADIHGSSYLRTPHLRSSTSWVTRRPARASRDAFLSAAWNGGLNDSMSSTVASSSSRSTFESRQPDASASARSDSSFSRSQGGSFGFVRPPRKADGFHTILCSRNRERKSCTSRSAMTRFGRDERNTRDRERMEGCVATRCIPGSF